MEPMFDRIVTFLERNQARFSVIIHEIEKSSNKIAEILSRELQENITLSQAAKSLLVSYSKEGQELYGLVVISGDEQLDCKLVENVLGATEVKLVPQDKIQEITMCVAGTVPPFPLFSKHPRVSVVVGESLINKNEGGKIFLTPGCFDRSIVLETADYYKIMSPQLVDVIKK